MALTLTITAESAEDLRTQLHVLLGASAIVALAHDLEKAPPEPSAPVPSQGDTYAEKTAESPQPAEITEQNQEVKKRRAHRKVKTPANSGAPEPSEPSHNGEAPATHREMTSAGMLDVSDRGDEDIFSGFDPIDAQKIKDEVLPQLRDLFVSGRVKQVRAILDKFGDGAKSIPEIEAKQFPAIRDFLAQGSAA